MPRQDTPQSRLGLGCWISHPGWRFPRFDSVQVHVFCWTWNHSVSACAFSTAFLGYPNGIRKQPRMPRYHCHTETSKLPKPSGKQKVSRNLMLWQHGSNQKQTYSTWNRKTKDPKDQKDPCPQATKKSTSKLLYEASYTNEFSTSQQASNTRHDSHETSHSKLLCVA